MLKTASSVINALGALVYQGTWDANANNPTLTSSVGTKGNYYVVSVAGTTTLDGISSWSVGDWAVFNGSVWQKVDGGTSESFVNLTVTGTANIATGNVVNMTSSNVTITGGTENAVTYTNVTISSGNVTVTNDNVAYSNISTALRTQSLTGYLYGNANTGNVTASTSIPVANVTGAVSSVTGTSPISSSGGTTPAISLNTSGVTAASYGGAANSATITVDTYGRITAASNTAIAIANTQVSGLGTMSTQNSNNVTITGGNVGANLSTSTAIPVANATGTLATGNGGTGLTSFTANGVIYATSTSALTTGTALTFDGTTYIMWTPNVTPHFQLKTNGDASGSNQGQIEWYQTSAGTNAITASIRGSRGGGAYNQTNLIFSTADAGSNTDRWTMTSDGNFQQLIASKGINFTANTPASGMTSQNLNWYEEGTWTPGQGGGLTVIGTFSSSGKYTRIGRTVFIKGTLSGSTSVAFVGGAVDITNNLPFSTSENALLCWNGNYTATATVITSGTTIYSVTGMAATTSVSFSGTYSI